MNSAGLAYLQSDIGAFLVRVGAGFNQGRMSAHRRLTRSAAAAAKGARATMKSVSAASSRKAGQGRAASAAAATVAGAEDQRRT